MDLIDHQREVTISKSIGEILVERTGKIDTPEIYSNSKEVLMMYPNDYSVVIREKNSKKHAEVKVYYGVGEVTNKFFKGRANRKVRVDSIIAFNKFIEEIK